MDETDKGFREFLGFWFMGFMRGMQTLDEPSRKKILYECGRACAQSYTAAIFRETKQNSSGLDLFLQNLGERFPGAHYELQGSKTIHVTYNQCGCDLVRLGLVNSPNFCECSAANLRENLEQAFGMAASVVIESSIIRGGKKCVLVATLEKDPG